MRKFGSVFYFLIFISFKTTLLFSQQEAAVPPPSWLGLWEEAKKLEKKGSYLEARAKYESLLKQSGLGEKGSSIRRAYEDLRIKIVFSKLETPDSIFHTVVPGDTLSKIAQKYGTTIELLQRSNGLSGDKIYVGSKLKVVQGEFSVLVKKRRNQLILLSHGESLKRYKVATGEEGSTPTGVFKVVNKLKNPTWFHAGIILPPDSPNNILGSRWLGFDTPGYGIHGTTLPETIGTHSSKGCVRMLNSDVEEFYDLIPAGTQVVVEER